MQQRIELIGTLKTLLGRIAPEAQVILYGSEARRDAGPNSDIDLLILVDKDHITPKEEDEIVAPIYDMEVVSGIIISPIVMTCKRWEEAKRQTLFYHNVMSEGLLLQ
jgi:predicted nucleotidyltransferase